MRTHGTLLVHDAAERHSRDHNRTRRRHLTARQWLRRDRSGNTAVAVDPGVLDTELARKYLVGELQLLPGVLQPLVRPIWLAAIPWLMLPSRTAAETMLYAATASAEQVRTRLSRGMLRAAKAPSSLARVE